ncbi:GNAT family N-acetyltransferase [Deinococcus yavapaiensis]|uniref:N-acetyltransferase domain-containing protein n=1 Tax=Deinococcus yavapaiensis KR-236 TaxID=694435 RepID=A0A318SHJ7_9DEIO|nr:GNAT family N-acetyltransferase [Deinococcus yavapaiensis]PYE50492.1 hypothetical protein DES52_11710 [Deinococcus yavapaiensis KR-236]
MTSSQFHFDPQMAPLDLRVLVEQRDAFYQHTLDGYRALPPDFQQRAGIERIPFSAGVLHLMRVLPLPTFNSVRGFGLSAPATEEDIAALLATVDACRAPAWGLVVDPRTRPADLPVMLEAHGIREVYRQVVLYASASTARAALELLPEGGPVAVEISQSNVSAAVALLMSQFGMPALAQEFLPLTMTTLGWKGYVVEEEDGPSSAGFLTVLEERALLHTTATRPESRGRGGQRALIARRLREGLTLGCEHFFVDVTAGEVNTSRRNLERMGFRPVFEVAYFTKASSN